MGAEVLTAIDELDSVTRGLISIKTDPGVWGGWCKQGMEGYQCCVTATLIDMAYGKIYEGLQPPLRTLMSPKSWEKCPLTVLNVLQDAAVKTDQKKLLGLVLPDTNHSEEVEYSRLIYTAIAEVSTRVNIVSIEVMNIRIRQVIAEEVNADNLVRPTGN